MGEALSRGGSAPLLGTLYFGIPEYPKETRRPSMSQKKETKQLVEKARDAGWRVEETGVAFKLYTPNGRDIVILHKTPSDHRALKNARSLMRRADPNLEV